MIVALLKKLAFEVASLLGGAHCTWDVGSFGPRARVADKSFSGVATIEESLSLSTDQGRFLLMGE